MPGGFLGRMQDVVCQLVGFWLVLQYIMKANGVEGTLQVQDGGGGQYFRCIISIMWIISVISIGMK